MQKITFAVSIFLISCNQVDSRADISNNSEPSTVETVQVQKSLKLFNDTLKFTILKKQSDIEYAFHEKYLIDTLSYADLITIEKRMILSIDSFNAEGQKRMDIRQRELGPSVKIDRNYFLIDTSRYRFQIVSALSNRNQKEAWVNAFCGYNRRSWRTEIIAVKDGGICYFKFAINLTTMQTLYFDVNDDI